MYKALSIKMGLRANLISELMFCETVLTDNDRHLLPRRERIWFLSKAEYKTEAPSCRLKREIGKVRGGGRTIISTERYFKSNF